MPKDMTSIRHDRLLRVVNANGIRPTAHKKARCAREASSPVNSASGKTRRKERAEAT